MTGVFPTQPKLPLFDNVENPKIRALIGIGLGCDALPGGVPGLGSSTLQNLLCTCNWKVLMLQAVLLGGVRILEMWTLGLSLH